MAEQIGPAMPPALMAAVAAASSSEGSADIGPAGPPAAVAAALAAAREVAEAAEVEVAAEDGGKKKRTKRPKKTRGQRMRELREFDVTPATANVAYDLVSTRHMDDQRFERAHKQKAREEKEPALTDPQEGTAQGPMGSISGTIDTIVRMEAGLSTRTIADKLKDPNRPTWEAYKKDKADQLDMGTKDIKDMIKYRKELDSVREENLAKGVNRKPATQAIQDSDEEESHVGPTFPSEDSQKSKKSKKEKKKDKKKDKKKKDKKKKDKKKKDKKRKRGDGDGSSSDEGGGEKFKLSNFMNASDSDDGR